MNWTTGFLLGAIISPPDAAAATSITRGLGLPKRVVQILEGESLVNDASGLTLYRFAVIAIAGVSLVCDLSGRIHTSTVRFEKTAGEACGWKPQSNTPQ